MTTTQLSEDGLPWPPLEHTYPSLSTDTTVAAHNVYLRKLRAMHVSERLDAAVTHSALVLGMAEERIRRQHPHMHERDVRLQLIQELYGSELAAKVRATARHDHH